MTGRSFAAYVVLGCATLPANRAAGQATDAALARELALLGGKAEALDHALPSFTCKETGTSQAWQGRRLREHVRFSATLRARRDDAGGHDEAFTLNELNGQPYTGPYTFPFYVSGGFDKGMRYFALSQQGCYRYALLPGQIDFATAGDAAQRPGCRDEGIQGFALLNADGEVTHLERRVSQHAVDAFRLAPFTAIDFAPVELNGEVFRLSQHMISEHRYDHTVTRFEVTYTECRLFHVTVTLADPGARSGESKPSVSPEAK